MLAKVQRHLHYAGIGLAISGIAPPPPPDRPTPADLLADSDAFGALPADERAQLAQHLRPVHHEAGFTLIREGGMPDDLFLLAAGTVELSQGEGAARRVLLRASPGDSIGMIGLIMGSAVPTTATALTPVAGYILDKPAFAAALRSCPGLAEGLLAQARRGEDWLRCEAAAHQDGDHTKRPEMLLVRLRMFLKRLDA
jgi:CRP-like cAMP-binding protein